MELKILNMVHHKYIMETKEILHDTHFIYHVTKLAAKGDLVQFIQNWSNFESIDIDDKQLLSDSSKSIN